MSKVFLVLSKTLVGPVDASAVPAYFISGAIQKFWWPPPGLSKRVSQQRVMQWRSSAGALCLRTKKMRQPITTGHRRLLLLLLSFLKIVCDLDQSYVLFLNTT